MKKIFVNLFFITILTSITSLSIASTTLIDTYTGNTYSGSAGYHNLAYWGSSTTETYGQIFTPSTNINVSSVSFYLKKRGVTDAIAQPFKAYIYEYSDSAVAVTGSAIAQSLQTDSTISTSVTEVSATFSSAAALTAGTEYITFYTIIDATGTQSNDLYYWLKSDVIDSQVGGYWYNNSDTDFTTSGVTSGSNYRLAFTLLDSTVADECAGTGPNCKDLNYWETIAYFGLTPVFTVFPSP
jgi:hypothetical protein|tara:strand:- start:111 stop:830 length:720 start_codon:yes stop_codon:yes gene_type:complete